MAKIQYELSNPEGCLSYKIEPIAGKSFFYEFSYFNSDCLGIYSEISEQIIAPRQGRTNPRVIKKPRSKFKGKKSLHRTGFTQLQPLTFAVVPAA
ncbi:MAG: hypothetical protein QNJ72_26360 [Pleurocapsa sp. MO_226.B13]|nr:hypothetical protein [Pleurocapsa sp. MO_226.B13]